MKLSVRLFAGLRERAGASEVVLEGLPEGLEPDGLRRELARRLPALGDLSQVRVAVGTRYAEEGRPLPTGEPVSLIPPVSGGSGAPGAPGAPGSGQDLARGVFELSPRPLDPAASLARVADGEHGGTALFVGTTRGEAGRVLRLEYEAFPGMAGPEMARIFARCSAEVATAPERALRMLVQHRTGTVAVGEPSVVVAVASPHRDAAFAACRFLIDELKASLPVWKKEFLESGAHWVGDRS